MSKKLLALLFALLAPTLLLAACGDDDEDAAPEDTTEIAEEETSEEETNSEGGIDQATLEEFIDAINEDPTIVCDEDNATAELLEAMGGIETCLEMAAEETGGEPYEITDITIDGDTATATIDDGDSESTAEFVQEGDHLKIAG